MSVALTLALCVLRIRELSDEEQLLAVLSAAPRRLPGEPRARPPPPRAALQLAHQETQVMRSPAVSFSASQLLQSFEQLGAVCR